MHSRFRSAIDVWYTIGNKRTSSALAQANDPFARGDISSRRQHSGIPGSLPLIVESRASPISHRYRKRFERNRYISYRLATASLRNLPVCLSIYADSNIRITNRRSLNRIYTRARWDPAMIHHIWESRATSFANSYIRVCTHLSRTDFEDDAHVYMRIGSYGHTWCASLPPNPRWRKRTKECQKGVRGRRMRGCWMLRHDRARLFPRCRETFLSRERERIIKTYIYINLLI